MARPWYAVWNDHLAASRPLPAPRLHTHSIAYYRRRVYLKRALRRRGIHGIDTAPTPVLARLYLEGR